MKKLVLFAVVLGAVSFTSCTKCKDCSYASISVGEQCGTTLETYEAAGYTCE